MRRTLSILIVLLLSLSVFSGCDHALSQNGGSQTTDDTLNTNAECEHDWERIGNLNESTAQDKCTKCGETRLYTDPDSINPDNGINDHVPHDSMLNLEIIDGKFRFQRIATTPCIVYSNSPISDMSNGVMYDDGHDILTAIFQATDGKDAIMDTMECEFSHYIYMFDNENEDASWHYRFAFCNCGAVWITNNNELLCSIEISDDELQMVLDSFDVKTAAEGSLLLRDGNVKSISVSSLPNGYDYSFKGKDAEKIIDYLSDLSLIEQFEENPNEYTGMTWVISLEYEEGDALQIYHFGNMFIRVKGGSWYKMTDDEALRFEALLEELN